MNFNREIFIKAVIYIFFALAAYNIDAANLFEKDENWWYMLLAFVFIFIGNSFIDLYAEIKNNDR